MQFNEFEDDFEENEQIDLYEPVEPQKNYEKESLENIICYTHSGFYEEKEKTNKLTLNDFKEENINKLKEDILYYYLSPKALLNYKQNSDNEERNYEFYKNLDYENFMSNQKESENIFLSASKSKLFLKQKKLSNYNNSLCAKGSIISNIKINETKMVNSNIIKNKLEECIKIVLKTKDENKILANLYELKEVLKKNKVEMKSLGLIHFNYIENNLDILLNIIFGIIEKKKDKIVLRTFICTCINILSFFQSSKLFYFIIEFLKNHIEILNDIKPDNQELIQFIPTNFLNFNLIFSNMKSIDQFKNICFLKPFLVDLKIFEKEGFDWDLKEYWSLNTNNKLFIFYKLFYRKKQENNNEINNNNSNGNEDNNRNTIINVNENNIDQSKEEINNNNAYGYLIYHLKSHNIYNFGKIDLINNIEEKKEKVLDINISIRKDLVYFFYIVENSFNENSKKCLKYKLYNQCSMVLLKENEIDLEDSFHPSKLLNDNKFIYCFSKENQTLIIKKH